MTEEEVPFDAEFLGQAGVQVGGYSRLEAAYGSGDGDDVATAATDESGQVEVDPAITV